jgi:25S rRNA (uracil2634-N3)-methyltransferase
MGKRDRARARQAKRKRARRSPRPPFEHSPPSLGHPNHESAPIRSNRRGVQYAAEHRTLVVGDGDFSFSEGLVAHRGSPQNLVCTSFDKRARVCAKYCDASKRLERLTSLGVALQHQVDACRLAETLRAPHAPRLGSLASLYDRVIFNFPHTGKQRVHLNRNLLRDFFASARAVLKPLGEVHVTLKLRPPYSGWRTDESAAESGFEVLRATRFMPTAFPGYRHRTTEADAARFQAERCTTICYGLTQRVRDSRRADIRAQRAAAQDNAKEAEKPLSPVCGESSTASSKEALEEDPSLPGARVKVHTDHPAARPTPTESIYTRPSAASKKSAKKSASQKRNERRAKARHKRQQAARAAELERAPGE